MISSKQNHVFRVFKFQAQEMSDNLKRLQPSIDVISHEDDFMIGINDRFIETWEREYLK